jgi:hypothetical protein
MYWVIPDDSGQSGANHTSTARIIVSPAQRFVPELHPNLSPPQSRQPQDMESRKTQSLSKR